MIAVRGGGPEHRVMIVDDHELVRRGVASLVEALPGFTLIAEAGSVAEGRSIAEAAEPDIVVLDLMLPDASGVELIQELKSNLKQVEILVLTMRDSERVMAEAVRAGARGYVLKSEAGERISEALVALSTHRSYLSPSASEILMEPQLLEREGKPLTNREREIVRLVASGNSNKAIAALLNISIKTVETHRTAAMHKIGAKTAADVVRYALRNELI